MKESFTRMSQEMERAFVIASRELQNAFRTARDNIQKNVSREPIICSNCGEKNPYNATYCTKCGKSLTGAASPQPTDAKPSPETQGSPQ
jgi:ribosomal protein L40E